MVFLAVTFNNGISAKLGSEEGREREDKNCLGSLRSLMEPLREHLSFCLICFSVISSVASGLWCVCSALARPFYLPIERETELGEMATLSLPHPSPERERRERERERERESRADLSTSGVILTDLNPV